MNETQHIEWKQSWRDDALRGICGAHGSPPPILRWDNGLWVELPFIPTQEQEQEQERTESFQPEWRLESRLESALAARIVMLLAAQAMGKAALASALGHKTVSGELHQQVKRLVGIGCIAMTIPDKPNSRLQKYHLTPKGKALLAALQKKEPNG